MRPDEIAAKVGAEVSADEMVELIRSNPIGSSPNDVKVRGGALRFSFGGGKVVLLDAEIRTPLPAGK